VESYLLAIVALVAAGMFSICQNDIYDEKIDVISNPERPLASGILSKNDMETASKIFLLFAVLAAYASSMYVLFFTCLMLFIYFIYSNPPLRLKRFGILNSFLVSLACTGAVLDGFFLANADKSILAFPFSLVLGIIIFHTIVANIRDIKDFEGDRVEGIKTLPVLLGLNKSKKMIAGSICFFYLLIPWYFHISFLIIPAIVAVILSWYFITKKDYKEWKGFAVYMIYLLLLIGAIFFR
jgi:4-hydroxybenzoate polyprenyltransferase